MIRPKNFKELRKSIVRDNEKNSEDSVFSYQNNINDGNLSHCLPNRLSFKKIGSLGQVQHKYYIPTQKEQSFLSPLKYKQPNITMPCQTDCFSSDYPDLKFTPKKSKKVSEGDSSSKKMNKNSGEKSNFLQFDGKIKKKVYGPSKQLGQNQKLIEQRISSKKKQQIKNHNFTEVEPLSFKSIIENSPQCNNTARVFGSKKKQPLGFTQKHYIQSQRINNNESERKSSLTKLKYQFNGVKRLLSKNQEESSSFVRNQQQIKKEDNQRSKESFLSPLKQKQKIITRKQSVECNNDMMSQQFRDVKINVDFKPNYQSNIKSRLDQDHYRHRNDDSQFDMVNMSRQSVSSRNNQLDMEPHF